jgi:oxygen-dependent protoporphyrinogen oxidase
MTSRKRVAIIGAGISGLCLAWFLQKKFGKNAEIFLFEKKQRVGGALWSHKQEPFLFELGPRTIRSKSPIFFELLQDLGIENELIVSSPDSAFRYLATKEGSLERLPRNLVDFFTSSLGQVIIKGALRSLFFSSKIEKDVSVYDYFSKRYGHEFTRRCIDPLAAGIYGGVPETLSMQSSFPYFGSFFKKQGTAKLYSFKQGISFLPESIAKRLQGILFLSHPVTSVVKNKDKFSVTGGSICVDVDHLFCASDAKTVAGLFPEAAGICKEIPLSPIVSVSFGFLQKDLLPKGFGFLCPSFVCRSLLGIIFDSNLFDREAKEHTSLFSVMMGGARDPQCHLLSDEQVIEKASQSYKKYLGITASYDEVFVSRAAIANYSVGHLDRVKEIENKLQGALCVGSSFYGVSVIDCIEHAYKCTKNLH